MNKSLKLSLPGAVVIAGILIALAIALTSKPLAPSGAPTTAPEEATSAQKNALLRNVGPITSAEHIYGNINAPITIVEYSDLDCPFCERFHTTLEQILAEYPDDVRWVYRHLPLDFHPHAYSEALIAECVGKLGGSEKFWSILPHLLAVPSSQSTEFKTDSIFAETSKLGIDTAQLQTCYESKEFKTKVDSDMASGAATGGNGTPWSIIIKPDGTYESINGAQPYTVVKAMIEEILK